MQGSSNSHVLSVSTPVEAGMPRDTGAGLKSPVLVSCIVTILLLFTLNLFSAADYVGIDNDDTMRLVEVRDLLNGQSWFDTFQYRLGLTGGTQMHWSRLVDLPIAALILLFGAFTSGEVAEKAALSLWPLIVTVPVLYAVALGCLRLGGRGAMHAGLALAVLFLVSGLKFRPGSIDHHNVQIALLAIFSAMLLDPQKRPLSYAVAGIMAALAIAIGAETTPIVAVGCLVVALQWVWSGEHVRKAIQLFSTALVATATATFFLTIPPRLYAQVTCDSLSLSFYVLSCVGGLGLFAAASVLSGGSRSRRLIGAIGCGGIVLATAFAIAPECLRSPLATLDPLLVSLWLNGITETRSLTDTLRLDQGNIGTYYAVGILGVLVSLYRVVRRDRAEAHLTMFALIAVSLAIALVQMRGSLFSNFLAIFPLSAAIAELRQRAQATPERLPPGLAFAGLTIASLPAAWALAGLLVPTAVRDAALGQLTGLPQHRAACGTKESLAPLITEPTGTVLATSELGTAILRYTPHRVLSAPYHRNQAGMLAELRTGMAGPATAGQMMRSDGVTLVAFCSVDPQTRKLIDLSPHGLYAQLDRNAAPDYLAELPGAPDAGLRIYRVSPGP